VTRAWPIHEAGIALYRTVMIDREAIRQRWRLFGSQLDERGRRHFAAVEARTAGRGGIVAVHEITGIARSTIGRGLDELEVSVLPEGRVRREGGGRQAVADGDPTLVADLERLVEPATMGDPERPLKWVSKSPAKLADAAKAKSPAMGLKASAASAAVAMSIFPCACRVAAALIMMAIATIFDTAIPKKVSSRMRCSSRRASAGRFLRG
jgi:hypothetical protein